MHTTLQDAHMEMKRESKTKWYLLTEINGIDQMDLKTDSQLHFGLAQSTQGLNSSNT